MTHKNPFRAAKFGERVLTINTDLQKGNINIPDSFFSRYGQGQPSFFRTKRGEHALPFSILISRKGKK
jgi:hypothetical protein